MKLSELIHYDLDKFSDNIAGLYMSFCHHTNRLDRFNQKGHIVSPHHTIKDPFTNEWLQGNVVAGENPKLGSIKRNVNALNNLVDRAYNLKPTQIPKSDWKHACTFLHELVAYAEQGAHYVAFRQVPSLSCFVHVGNDEIPFEDLSAYTVLGTDSDGVLYVKNSFKENPLVPPLAKLYKMIERLRAVLYSLEDAINENK